MLNHRFTASDLSGKADNKSELIRAFELDISPNTALLGSVSRLTGQKGFELLPDILPILLRQEDMALIVLGSGEEKYEKYFQWLRDKFRPRWVCSAATTTNSRTRSKPARTCSSCRRATSRAG